MQAPAKDITFYKKEPDKFGFVRIYMSVWINNRQGWYPTGVKCLKDSWIQGSKKTGDGRINSDHVDYKKLNAVLRQRKVQLQEAFDDLAHEKIAATIDRVRKKYNALVKHEASDEQNVVDIKRDYGFLEFMDLYVKERSKIRAKGYLRQFKATRNHVATVFIRRWKEKRKSYTIDNVPDPSFEDINMVFYADLVDYLIDDLELENNSVYGIVKRIKTVLGAALIDPRTKHQNIPLDFKLFDDLYIKPKVFWLDWETDIQCIEEFEPLPDQKGIKDVFLFMCYTGLRQSDVFNLKTENIVKRKDTLFLDHTIVKTKLDHHVQLSSKAVAILKKWNYRLPKIYQHDLNSGIKTIAKAAGLKWEKANKGSYLLDTIEKVRYSGNERVVSLVPRWQMISTHTGRRSFGRRWVEQDGDIRKLQLYYGHATLQQTVDYIGWSTQEVNAEMSRVFG